MAMMRVAQKNIVRALVYHGSDFQIVINKLIICMFYTPV
jgi:hypothetical protein